jgi:hypothetical protein
MKEVGILKMGYDQMVQATRSGKQNIAEGSMASVMITQLSYQNSVFSRPVDNPMLVVDPPRPIAGKAVFERFRFAGSSERIANDLMDKPVDAFEYLPVCLLPVEVILPCVFGKDRLHSASLRALPPPRSSSAMDSRRRLAFFGTRNRYAVSSIALKSSRESITTDSSFCRVMMTGSWFSHTFFIVAASRVRAFEYVIVSIVSPFFILYILLYNITLRQSRRL